MLSGCPTPSISCSLRRPPWTSWGLVAEAEQTIWNLHVVVRRRRGSPERRQPDTRRLVIGRSDANRVLTLVIEETVEPTTWLLITGWDSTPAERKMLGRS
jgi:hypothetical protein